MRRSVRRALLSVSDKSGLVEFARSLVEVHRVELVATGGTKAALAAAGLAVKDVSEYTNFPEVMDGRVKTLHPAVYAGLLAKRSKPEHMGVLADLNLPEFDLLVCNLYPFEATVAKPNVTDAEAIENIDIGGPCMVRAAAKNCESVVVAVDPSDYAGILAELAEGGTTTETRRALAAKAFARILAYDAAIAGYFASTAPSAEPFPARFTPSFERVAVLRQGENPHQQAALYREPGITRACLATAVQLHGKELSYNNLLDLDSAINLVREFTVPAVTVVKHNNPCGAATAATLAEAFTQAWDGDPLSAFGGIIAFNKPVDVNTANAVMAGERFVECLVAPGYDPEALALLKSWKKNVRLLTVDALTGPPQGLDLRRIDGGLLVQTRDSGTTPLNDWRGVTNREATTEELASLHFAWTICKHVKSNAITLASGTTIVGVGAGQMSRVLAVEIAIKKAGDRAKGSVLASDAFFPFPDNVELAAAAGITAIVQPGGSVKDADAIAACDAHGIAMLFTGRRHFRH